MLKKLDKSLDVIKNVMKQIVNMPYLKKLPTIIVIGMPNVGKSTLLKNITGANVEIKSYPFTTKRIQVGFFNYKFLEFQILDSPGLLDRTIEKQNIIEKQTEIALRTLASSFLFIVDVTQSIKPQRSLIKKFINYNKPFFIIFNKIKLISNEDLIEYKTKFLHLLNINKDLCLEIEQINNDLLEKDLEKIKQLIYKTYLKNTQYINNWDLVDLSAPKIIGVYLLKRKNREILYKLAKSNYLWEKRISIISTYTFIKNKQFKDTLRISRILLHDKHDLIHKAVGWMLREIGKIDQKTEESFLKKYYQIMPRTMLRYAIEKFSEEKRKFYLYRTKNKLS